MNPCILVPTNLTYALQASCTILSIAFDKANPPEETIFTGPASNWVTAVYSLTLSTNLSASRESGLLCPVKNRLTDLFNEVLLAYRIWKANRDALRYLSSDRLTPVLRAVVESGAIYSATMTIALILFVCNSIGSFIILDMVSLRNCFD